ncbi:hypothetical protein BGZ80_004125, partial [Entomortierella chlamydospora]
MEGKTATNKGWSQIWDDLTKLGQELKHSLDTMIVQEPSGPVIDSSMEADTPSISESDGQDNESDERREQELFNLMNAPLAPVSRDPFKNTSPPASSEEIETVEYKSLGNMNVQCAQCSALMWNE